MKIFLSATNSLKECFLNGKLDNHLGDMCVLESFYSIKEWQIPYIHKFKDFLLDSGAFTFLNAKGKKKINFEQYADNYADFIKAYDIKNYFELDLDALMPLQEVERLRERIENRSGRKSIPVWHKTRGKEYYENLCKNYPYIALGGIALKEIPRQKFEKLFPWFISTAHKYGCKLHGLGYTGDLHLHKFDSVDSATWISGGKLGEVHYFNNGIVKERSVINQQKIREIKNEDEVALFNLLEWVKYSKYAELYL